MNDSRTCECQYARWKPDHRPCRRTFANGTVHWGMWCRVCGTWFSLPKSMVDVANAEPFDEQRREHARAERFEQLQREHLEEWEPWARWYEAFYLQTSHWRELRAAVLKRDPVCVGCGQVESEQAHHLTYDRLGCELLTDLVGMCRPCHQRAHRHNRAMCPCRGCVQRRGGEKVPEGMRVSLARPGYAEEMEETP